MGRLSALLLALLIGGTGAVALSSCGGGDAELLPGAEADRIESELDQVQQLVADGDCTGAEDAVAEVTAAVEGLDEVAARLKTALAEGTARLSEVVSRCGEEVEEEAEPSPENDVEAEELEREALEAEGKAEKAEEKAEKQEEKEEEKAETPDTEEGNLPPPAADNGKGEGPDEAPPPSTPAPEQPTEEGSSGGVAPSVGVE